MYRHVRSGVSLKSYFVKFLLFESSIRSHFSVQLYYVIHTYQCSNSSSSSSSSSKVVVVVVELVVAVVVVVAIVVVNNTVVLAVILARIVGSNISNNSR